MHGAASSASAWIQRWAHLVPPQGTVLDVACGAGRHGRWFSERGHKVSAVDRDSEATAGLIAANPLIDVRVADIEAGPWPFAGQTFDAVVVTNYLWRALTPTLIASVAPGGVLLMETFALGQASVGRPRNPEFLLQPGEWLQILPGLRIVAFEDGFVDAPERFVQRVAAVRERTDAAAPPRHRLA